VALDVVVQRADEVLRVEQGEELVRLLAEIISSCIPR
jgi:hypothetical protein